MAHRIDARFEKLKQEGKKAFIPFMTAGYPNQKIFPMLLNRFAEAGADIIEIGMPFSDPMADGPAIQAANIQAFKGGITTSRTLDMITEFRKSNDETPIILMGYYNPIYAYGLDKFLKDASTAGVDALIIPDLPPEEDEELRKPAARLGIKLIRLIAPTSDEERRKKILKDASGFLYYVAVRGITGQKSASADELSIKIQDIKKETDLPVCIGFGVSTPDQARDMSKISDGVIVGSAIINRLAAHIDENGNIQPHFFDETVEFIKELAKAAHAAS